LIHLFSIYLFIDVDPPMFASCPETVKVRTADYSTYVNWTVPEAIDNVKVKTVESTHTPGSHFLPGETKVNYTAIDVAGNTATCVFSVFVLHGMLNYFKLSIRDLRGRVAKVSDLGPLALTALTDMVSNPQRDFFSYDEAIKLG
jgi:L-ascorbate metabolism protein UlaG (beta-lactamase superfamily)